MSKIKDAFEHEIEKNYHDQEERGLTEPRNKMDSEFKKELTGLINSYTKENRSNTPDYILAEYLEDCLRAYDKATNERSFHNAA